MTAVQKRSGISRDEWLQALNDAGIPTESDAHAVTICEMADMLDVHRQTAWRHLEALVKRGKATRTRKRTNAGDGKQRFLVAYRLKETARKAK